MVQKQFLIDSDTKEAICDGRSTLELFMIKAGISKKLQLVENEFKPCDWYLEWAD